MNTQRLIITLLLIVFLLFTGCAPKAATSEPLASSAGESQPGADSAPWVEHEAGNQEPIYEEQPSPVQPESVSPDVTYSDSNAPQVIAQEPTAGQPAGQ